MAIMLGALYKALIEASGVNEETARAAAEEVAGYDSRLAAIETKLAVLQALVGVNITFTLALGFGLLWLVLRLGENVAAIAAKVGVP